MKHLDIMEPGGYPFDDISISFLQQMHGERDAFLQSVFGDNRIVKGVVLNTQTNLVSDGLISVDGKLYHFVGGAPNTSISKKVIETKRQYEDGVEKKAFLNEFYEFGSAGTDVRAFDSLKRWYHNQPILKEIKFVGASVTNALLPEGWFIADGQNGTNDLRSKFIVGVDSRDTEYSSVGKTGGEKKHALTVEEMPAHQHSGSTSPAGSHKHGFNDDQAGSDVGTGYIASGGTLLNQSLENAFTKEAGNHSHNLTTNDKGGDEPHENRPPYFAMIIIQFIGL